MATATKQETPNLPFEAAVIRAKVAQICDHVGYHAITQVSSNVLVDIFRRTITHLARHCKDTANNNRRTEPVLKDLAEACDFVGISVQELQEHIDSIKIPLKIDITHDEEDQKKSSNRIQRNLPVDDLLEAEKNIHLEEQEDGENKLISENCPDEEEKPPVPLLRDTYEQLASNFKDCTPVKPDKTLRTGRIVVVASTKLKIKAPIPPVDSTPTNSEKTTPVKASPSLKEKTSRKKKMKEPMKKIKMSRKTKVSGRKGKLDLKSNKKKSNIRPLNLSEAEPPSFLPILGPKLETLDEIEQIDTFPSINPIEKSLTPSLPEEPIAHDIPIQLPSRSPLISPKIKVEKVPTPPIQSSSKPTKVKKKKKSSSNKFAITTETVTVEAEEKEWFCPKCKGPDDGDLMVQCDACEQWYHLRCTRLKKPPEDDENWECDKCSSIKSKSSKKSQVTITIQKTKTPEPIIKTPTPSPPPPVQLPPPVITTPKPATPQPLPPARIPLPGTSQDDLCPECNLPDDGTMMIQCEDPFCARWFHGKCVNLLEEPKEDESWFCKVCVEKQQSAFKRRRRAK